LNQEIISAKAEYANNMDRADKFYKKAIGNL